ncbi:MAG: hypothetical protein QM656_03990 [Paracoccaceae bacterium]
MIRSFLCLLALLTLAACGGPAEPKWAPDDAVARAHFVADGPASITLFTILSNRNDSGAHSGLMINGSERILFDPAGTWRHPKLPERNDVWFGINDKMVAFYIDYHARETFRVVEQTVLVPRGVADLIAARAKGYGAVPKAQCSRAISWVLAGQPGFESITRTWFPKNLMQEFGKLPGVTEKVIRDEDADDNHGVLLIQEGEDPNAAVAEYERTHPGAAVN